MNGIYEAAALGMRYWFLIAAIVVLLGAAGISLREFRDKRYVLGMAQVSIGYLNVMSGPDDILGTNIQLMPTNTIGRSRRVDIVLSDRSVDKAHSQIYLKRDGSVFVNRLGRGEVILNGTPVHGRAAVYTGDIICFGNIVTELYVKEGQTNGT